MKLKECKKDREEYKNTNINKIKANIAILLTGKMDFKEWGVTTNDSEGYSIMTKGSLQQGDIRS